LRLSNWWILALSALALAALVGCGRAPSSDGEGTLARGAPDGGEDERVMEKVVKTEAEWRKLLTPEQYRVTREAGTERAFTGKYWNTDVVGTYHCVACDLPLFRSDQKFVSSCGWPSFFEPMEGFHITEHRDTSLGMARVEVRCRRCDAHLGHVFEDGPPPTGLRYCINSASLKLVDAKAEKADPK